MRSLSRGRDSFALCIFFFSLFFLHRVFLSKSLGVWSLPSLELSSKALLAGALSDFWMAAAFCFLSVWWSSRAQLVFSVVIIAVLTFHLPYVEFFKVTFRAMHLSYLWDVSFLMSSWQELYRQTVLLQCLLMVGLFLFLGPGVSFKSSLWRKPAAKFNDNVLGSAQNKIWVFRQNGYLSALVPFVVLIFGILSNAQSNRWQRRWDLAPILTLNPVVGFVTDLSKRSALEQPQHLEKMRQFEIANGNFSDWIRKHKKWALEKGKTEESLEQLREALRSEFSNDTLLKEPRYLVVVLMESQRALESAVLRRHHEVGQKYALSKGFSESLDSYFTGKGIFFSNAFSTGIVSRSGAESTSCNSYASTLHNALRDNPIARPMCAKEVFEKILRDQGPQKTLPDAHGWWVHGGFPTFDGQMEFWKKQGFEIPLNILKIDHGCSVSGYGVSDDCFFNLAEEHFFKSQNFPSPGLHFVNFATVGHHSPFLLPSDAEAALADLVRQRKIIGSGDADHLRSADYNTLLLSRWLKSIENTDFWKKGVFVFVGDHGHQAEFAQDVVASTTDLSSDTSSKSSKKLGDQEDVSRAQWPSVRMNDYRAFKARALANVYFVLSGGLVAKHLSKIQSPKPWVISREVSQADVLPSFADLIASKETDFPFVGTSLFESHRAFPVGADLVDEWHVPSPESGAAFREFYEFYLYDSQSGAFAARNR